MTTVHHSSIATVVLAAAALAVVVSGLIALMALALFLFGCSTSSAIMSANLPSNSTLFITAVPTGAYRSSLVSSPLPTDTYATISPTIPVAQVSVPSVIPLLIPMPLVDQSLSLFTEPVAVPLELQIPALKIKAAVLGVGLTSTNVMASPFGRYANDPIWQTVFWYRGGGIPGDVGTATFAGHYDDTLGRPAVFGYLGDLQIGNLIIIRDTRNGHDIPFIVTETKRYTDQEAANPTVLARIFGSKSVSDAASQPVSDQISHLTLITCDGAWAHGSFNLRLIVYAVRANYPSVMGE